MAERLSEAVVRKALAPVRGQRLIWDTDVKGFGVRLTPGGSKSFIVDYRSEGRQRRITIGAHPDWTVAAARETAKSMKREVDAGHDPMGERQAMRDAPSLYDLWKKYEQEHLPHKAPRTQVDERTMWDQIILPRFGKMKLLSITHDLVDALHRDITATRGTPIRANRTIEVLRKAFNLAIRWNWMTENPASGVRRNPEEKRTRYLSKEEMMALARALHDHAERVSANAVKLLMLTGARRGEVLGATWDMFDLDNQNWTKPSSHTKQRRVHRVPLNAPATELLKEMREAAEREAANNGGMINPFVFAGANGKPLVDIKRTWASLCRKAGLGVLSEMKGRDGKPMIGKNGKPIMKWHPSARIHDLRHSYASVLISSGTPLAVIGQMLGHTQVQTTLRYSHLFDDPLRKAAETVGNYVTPATRNQNGS